MSVHYLYLSCTYSSSGSLFLKVMTSPITLIQVIQVITLGLPLHISALLFLPYLSLVRSLSFSPPHIHYSPSRDRVVQQKLKDIILDIKLDVAADIKAERQTLGSG